MRNTLKPSFLRHIPARRKGRKYFYTVTRRQTGAFITSHSSFKQILLLIIIIKSTKIRLHFLPRTKLSIGFIYRIRCEIQAWVVIDIKVLRGSSYILIIVRIELITAHNLKIMILSNVKLIV
ncbi:hypothetical protein D3C81_820070 [compost metagenome]